MAPAAVDGRLGELFTYAGDNAIPLYCLSDEYDNFANTVLAHHGREAPVGAMDYDGLDAG